MKMWDDDQLLQDDDPSDMVPLSGYIKKKSKMSVSDCAMISRGCLQCIHELNDVGLIQPNLKIEDFFLRRIVKVSLTAGNLEFPLEFTYQYLSRRDFVL